MVGILPQQWTWWRWCIAWDIYLSVERHERTPTTCSNFFMILIKHFLKFCMMLYFVFYENVHGLYNGVTCVNLLQLLLVCFIIFVRHFGFFFFIFFLFLILCHIRFVGFTILHLRTYFLINFLVQLLPDIDK